MEHNTTLRHFDAIINAFTVSDIAEPIYMMAAPDKSAFEIMLELEKPPEELTEEEKEFWRYGIFPWELKEEDPDYRTVAKRERFLSRKCLVRDEQQIYGYIDVAAIWLEEETAEEVAFPITADQIVPSSMPLVDLFPLFQKNEYYFVLNRNEITHIVYFRDMDKLPMKLCIFSLIIRLENAMHELTSYNVKATVDSVEKLQRANNKRYLKIRNGLMKLFKKRPSPDLLLRYTTIQDKWDILSYHSTIHEALEFKTRQEADNFFETTRKVRNQIAHDELLLELLDEPSALNEFLERLEMVTSEMIKLQHNIREGAYGSV